MAQLTPAELETELKVLLARAEVRVPEEAYRAILAGYADLREQIALLHLVRPATSEPSNIYRLSVPETAL